MKNDYTDAMMDIEFQRAYREMGRILGQIRTRSERLAGHMKKHEWLCAHGINPETIEMRIDTLRKQIEKFIYKRNQLIDYKEEISIHNQKNANRLAEHQIIMAAYERAYKENGR
ncbi:hypothetical protein HDR61_04215 [bacterium]|nr:hypothetical protein [bacterium]